MIRISRFCKCKENPNISDSLALLLLWQVWMARILHDRTGVLGKTVLELDAKNETFLNHMLDKTSVALSVFSSNSSFDKKV